MIRKVLFLVGNRHFLIRKRHFGVYGGRYVEACLVPQGPLPSLVRSFSNDPQQTFRRSRHHCRRRSHGLLRHDGSKERCLPGYERFLDLPRPLDQKQTGGWLLVSPLRGSHRCLAQFGHCADNGIDLLGHPRRRRNERFARTGSAANRRKCGLRVERDLVNLIGLGE